MLKRLALVALAPFSPLIADSVTQGGMSMLARSTHRKSRGERSRLPDLWRNLALGQEL